MIAWAVVAGHLAESMAFGQGVIYTPNRNNFVFFPIYDSDGTTLLCGPDWVGQLWAGPDEGSLGPYFPLSVVRQGAACGYLTGETIELGFAQPGDVVAAQMRVYNAAAWQTFDEAVQGGGKWGISNIIRVRAGPPESRFEPDGYLVGMQPIALVPEPETAWLAMQALVVWLISARRSTSQSPELLT